MTPRGRARRARRAWRRSVPSGASGRRRRSASPRVRSRCSTPARLRATRLPGPMARDRLRRASGSGARGRRARPARRRAAITASRPAPSVSVPVTTVPLPLRREHPVDPQPRPPPVDGRRRRPGERRRAPPRARRPRCPVGAATGTIGAPGEERAGDVLGDLERAPARRARDRRARRPSSGRPRRGATPTSSRIRRCSSLCGFHPSVAATTNRQASTPPTPASMLRRNRTWPGTSTKLTASPSSTAWAKPRSIVRPRRCSSAKRSGSVPGEGQHERRLAVVDVAGGGDHPHAAEPRTPVGGAHRPFDKFRLSILRIAVVTSIALVRGARAGAPRAVAGRVAGCSRRCTSHSRRRRSPTPSG